MKFVFIGDIHMSRETESRRNAYLDTLDKMEWLATETLRRWHGAVLVITGDIFDNLNQYLPATALTRLAEILQRFQRVYYIMGNHDWHRSAGYAAEDEMPAVLERMAGNIRRLDDGSEVFDEESGFHIIARPWRKEFDLRESAALECPDGYDTAHTLILCHAYLLPKAQNPLGQYNSVESLKRPAAFYIVGHYHGQLGMLMFKAPTEDRMFRVLVPGSLTRIRVDETHNPKAYFVELSKGGIIQSEAVDIPCRPHAEVFVDRTDTKAIQNIRDEISGFVSQLQVSREPMTKDGFLAAFRVKAEEGVPEDRRAAVFGFMDGVISNL